MTLKINQAGFSKILAVIILVIAVAGALYFLDRYIELSIFSRKVGPGLPPTAGWQTYRNKQYGFEVKYPKDWILRDSRLFTKDGNEAFYISASETKYNLITDWLDVEFSGDRAQFKPTYTNLNISNYVWIHYPEPISIGGCDEVTTTIRKKILYRLRTPPSSCKSYETSSQIPSTFKFLR